MRKFSFVVIGHNVEKYIEKCLRSVINQSEKNIEVIFVDDGSTDNTKKVVSSIFKYDERCKYIYQENKGANSARINGFKNAKGKYITFIDGDDWVTSDLAEKSLMRLSEGNYDFLAYNFKFYYENEDVRINPKFEDTVYKEDEYIRAVLQSRTPHYIWNKVYRYEFLKEIKFEKIPQITMGDDLAVNVRMGMANPLVLSCNECYYYYYLKSNSVSQKMNDKYIEILDALMDIEKNIETYAPEDEEFVKMVEYQYFCAYYYYVVKSKYKRTRVQNEINKKWREKNVIIKDNNYIKEYVKKISRLEFILLKLYNFNYNLGYCISRIYIYLINICKSLV